MGSAVTPSNQFRIDVQNIWLDVMTSSAHALAMMLCNRYTAAVYSMYLPIEYVVVDRDAAMTKVSVLATISQLSLNAQ